MSDSTYDFAPQDPRKGPEKGPLKEPDDDVRPLPPPTPPEAVMKEPITERICPHCGFRTMGKPSKGRCPECAGMMDMAAAADLLQFAGPDWVRALSRGAALAGVGVFLHVIGAVLGAWGMASMIYLQILAAGALAGGMWMLTTPEEDGMEQARAAAAQAARWSAIAAAVLWLVLYLVTRGNNPGTTRLVLAALCGVQALTAGAGGFFLSALSTRIPNDSLASQFLNMAWLVAVVLLIALVDLFAGMRTQYAFYLFFCVFPVMGVMAALMIWPAVTLVRLALELWNVAVAGEAIVAKREARAAKK